MFDANEPVESPVSLDFDYDANTIWQRVGGFSTLHAWHPGVTSCQAEGEHVGALRTVTLADGNQIEERLDQLDPAERVQVYSMTDPQPPFLSYTSTIQVIATGEGRCRVCWTAQFSVVPEVPVAEVVELLRSFYLGGLESLKTRLEN